MICGQNYHGGNVQNGCGAHFDWEKAKRYQPQVVKKPDEPVPKLEIPDIAREFVHVGVGCDVCHNEIKGLRFHCLNCRADYCENCEMQATTNHAQNHTFKIIANE